MASGHGGTEYEMLMDGTDLVAQLHQWEADEHPHLGDPGDRSRGNGVLLWFATDDFGSPSARATALTPSASDDPATRSRIAAALVTAGTRDRSPGARAAPALTATCSRPGR